MNKSKFIVLIALFWMSSPVLSAEWYVSYKDDKGEHQYITLSEDKDIAQFEVAGVPCHVTSAQLGKLFQSAIEKRAIFCEVTREILVYTTLAYTVGARDYFDSVTLSFLKNGKHFHISLNIRTK